MYKMIIFINPAIIAYDNKLRVLVKKLYKIPISLFLYRDIVN